MNNSQKLAKAFAVGLNISPDKVTDALAYRVIPEWDSLGHMALVTELEKVFAIMLDTDEILDLSSFARAKEILGKHQINFSD